MKICSLETLEKVPANMKGAEKAYKQLPISRADGTPSVSFRVFTLEPGGHTPYHEHDFEHMNYVIEGRGVIVNENGEESEFKKGDFALILPGEKHQYRNNSENEVFIIICAVPKEYE
ncbi:MAG: cupin domain-containing protein [Deltaproteobacteria bacterium]|nr:cupin domain-containing protein [Deltaproteobacteria bacterium]